MQTNIVAKNVFLLLCFSLFLISCDKSQTVNDRIRESESLAQMAINEISPDNKRKTPLQVVDSPWYGSETVPMMRNKVLPRALTQSNALTLTFTEPVSMMQVARMIEQVTSIPVSISNNIYDASLGSISTRTFLPTGGQEVSGNRLIWSGSLDALLNQISNVFVSEWEYKDGRINFVSEITKTFMLNAFANELTFSGGASSTGAGDSSAPELEIVGETKISIWEEIEETVGIILGDLGQSSFSPSTGMITVTARSDVMKRVENYLRYQNKMRLRRVAISVKVLSVETSDNLALGFDVQGVIKAALGDSLTVSGSGNADDGLSLSILKNATGDNASGNIASTLTATEGIRRARIVHSGSIVTLSDHPAPLQVSRQIAYLERISSSGGDTASVSLEPGTVNVGLFMNVLPRIVDNDRILMRMGISITDTDPNFRTFGSGTEEIELPEVDTTGFLQNAVVSNGETLVLAGFEKTTDSLDDKNSPAGLLFGGSHTTNESRELLVLLINSRILPEQPLTILGE